MCGISALFSTNNADRNLVSALHEMNRLIRHRGPDDEGYALIPGNAEETPVFLSGADTPDSCLGSQHPYTPRQHIEEHNSAYVKALLGHRRLSIIDLSPAGHQPMCCREKRHVIIYNGEVYNYLELRKELEALGHRFESHSDTEVILAAYSQWGRDCLQRFNGMFAFIIYDARRHMVFAARDRFGIKPLYYWKSPDGFIAFASEIKQFTVLPGWNAQLNYQRAYDFLNWGLTDHGSETLFSGVSQLRGGECIECGIDEAISHTPVRQWYTLSPRRITDSLEDASERFRELFIDSVRLRLRADVPVGTGLSGGLDSSSIVCVANELLGQQKGKPQQQTFSACAEDQRFDEREYINEVISATGVHPNYVFPDINKLFDTLDQLTWHQDEPIASTSIYAEWNVFQLVSSTSVKVTLDGHGADELLAGYHSFFRPLLAGLARKGKLVRLFQEMKGMRKQHDYSYLHAMMIMSDMLLPETLRQPLRRMSGIAAASPNWLESRAFGIKEQDPALEYCGKTSSLNQFSWSQIMHTSLPNQLHWSDRDSMAHSIEARIPFLDYRLVEYVLGCPDLHKIRDGVTKVLLRAGMRDILPEKILTRRDKMGFVTPEELWVRKDNPGLFLQQVEEAVKLSGGLINREAISIAEQMISGKIPFSFQLWRWVSFGNWIRRFSVSV